MSTAPPRLADLAGLWQNWTTFPGTSHVQARGPAQWMVVDGRRLIVTIDYGTSNHFRLLWVDPERNTGGSLNIASTTGNPSGFRLTYLLFDRGGGVLWLASPRWSFVSQLELYFVNDTTLALRDDTRVYADRAALGNARYHTGNLTGQATPVYVGTRGYYGPLLGQGYAAVTVFDTETLTWKTTARLPSAWLHTLSTGVTAATAIDFAGATYDERTKKIYYVLGGGSKVDRPSLFAMGEKLISYDIAADRWELVGANSVGSTVRLGPSVMMNPFAPHEIWAVGGHTYGNNSSITPVNNPSMVAINKYTGKFVDSFTPSAKNMRRDGTLLFDGDRTLYNASGMQSRMWTPGVNTTERLVIPEKYLGSIAVPIFGYANIGLTAWGAAGSIHRGAASAPIRLTATGTGELWSTIASRGRGIILTARATAPTVRAGSAYAQLSVNATRAVGRLVATGLAHPSVVFTGAATGVLPPVTGAAEPARVRFGAGGEWRIVSGGKAALRLLAAGAGALTAAQRTPVSLPIKIRVLRAAGAKWTASRAAARIVFRASSTGVFLDTSIDLRARAEGRYTPSPIQAHARIEIDVRRARARVDWESEGQAEIILGAWADAVISGSQGHAQLAVYPWGLGYTIPSLPREIDLTLDSEVAAPSRLDLHVSTLHPEMGLEEIEVV